jgi:hypothetical protein
MSEMAQSIEDLKAQRDALDAQITRAQVDKRNAEREARQAAKRKAYNESSARCLADARNFIEINEVQHNALYAKAYEDAHDSGYQEVESYYGDLLQLIVDFQGAANKP